uniref:Uncharacterized protein n=1 Tax=Micrurus spixii TaxID=129469 RepID=A0A2D4M4R5_9SAUR
MRTCVAPLAQLAGTHMQSCICGNDGHMCPLLAQMELRMCLLSLTQTILFPPHPIPGRLPSRKDWEPLLHNMQRLTEECVTEFAYITHPALALSKRGWNGSRENSNKILVLRNVYSSNEE